MVKEPASILDSQSSILVFLRVSSFAALASRPSFMITHSPGHMFITDLPNHALAAI